MEIEIKAFEALSVNELYELLALRNEVFIIEQNCVYQDLDGYDQKALHVLVRDNNELAAYARIFNSGIKYETASIGRVIVSPRKRNLKLGHVLVKHAIEGIQKHFKTHLITISAQEQLQKFYGAHGFETTSESYFEDNIPHVEMQIR